VKESEVEEMEMRLAGPDVSLDAPLDEESETPRVNLVRDFRASAGSTLEGREIRGLIREKLKEFRSTLDERDRQIFDERLLAEEPATLRDLGERFGVSRERVRQIEAELKNRLKEFLERFHEVRDALE
jgi:RNA polymerase sigma-32 factor